MIVGPGEKGRPECKRREAFRKNGRPLFPIQLCDHIRSFSQGEGTCEDSAGASPGKLRLKMVFIETDEDLDRIQRTYLEKGEAVIKSLLAQLHGLTFGGVFRRENSTARDRDHYVAIIDCRGEKRHRRYFTKWHEIAHILTLKHQLELPFVLRDTKVKQPEEQMMDVVAGQIGFHPAIFHRGFRAELEANGGRFDFRLIQRVRDNVCSEASYESALHACLSAYDRPCLLVRVAMGLSKSEQKKADDPQSDFLLDEQPIPELRAVSVRPNDAARSAKLNVHWNMRVPAGSHLYRAFQERAFEPDYSNMVRRENLAVWEHSDGSSLASREVTVYTRVVGDGIQALLVDEHASDLDGSRWR